jgi:hypothetical protein
MGVSFFWRTAQKIKIVVKNKHIISVLIFSSITGHGQSWACRRAESGPHMNTQTIFGSLLSHWPSLLYVLFVFLFQGMQEEEEDEQSWLHEQRILPSNGMVVAFLHLTFNIIYLESVFEYVCLSTISVRMSACLFICVYVHINISIDMFVSIRNGCLVVYFVCLCICLSVVL